MNERIAYSTCLLYFLAGGVAGVSAGLLLAPKSGKVTREAMRSKLRETADTTRDLKDRVVRQGEQVREEAARRVGAAASALAGNGTDDVSA
jgi:gas vesicle protein